MNSRTIDISGVRSPYLAEYLGCWSMLSNVLDAAVERIASVDLVAHVAAQQTKAEADGPRGGSYPYTINADGIATIEVRGTLMKQESSLGDSTSTVMLRRTIRAAAADPLVKGMMLCIDSPGGTTLGTEELGSDIAAAANNKPVWAYIDGCGASAAYWVASQADEISCGPLAVVGSIGTFMVAYDKSAMAAQQGVKVHVVRSAEAKGAGVQGTEITPKQLSEWQRQIDDSQAVFTSAVASGRGISLDDAKKLADARVHVGASAKSVGLVDTIESLDSAMQRLAASIRSDSSPAGPIQPPSAPGKRKQTTTALAQGAQDETNPPAAQSEPAPAGEAPAISQEKPMPPESAGAPVTAPTQANDRKPATMAELKAACAGASSDFLVEQSEKGSTIQEAKDNFIHFQAAQIRARDEELAKARAATVATQQTTGQPETRKPGVKPLESNTQTPTAAETTGGDARSTFEARVKEQVKLGRPRAKAVSEVAKSDPELHQQYIEEATETHRSNHAAAEAASRAARPRR